MASSVLKSNNARIRAYHAIARRSGRSTFDFRSATSGIRVESAGRRIAQLRTSFTRFVIDSKLRPFATVRGIFTEGGELYPGAFDPGFPNFEIVVLDGFGQDFREIERIILFGFRHTFIVTRRGMEK